MIRPDVEGQRVGISDPLSAVILRRSSRFILESKIRSVRPLQHPNWRVATRWDKSARDFLKEDEGKNLIKTLGLVLEDPSDAPGAEALTYLAKRRYERGGPVKHTPEEIALALYTHNGNELFARLDEVPVLLAAVQHTGKHYEGNTRTPMNGYLATLFRGIEYELGQSIQALEG